MSKVFARNLRAYREMSGLSQTDLAKYADTTRNALANYETGRSEPSFDVLCKLAHVLGVSITDLLNAHEVPDYVRRVQVTDQESFLLDVFRNADPTYQGVALDILRAHQKGAK